MKAIDLDKKLGSKKRKSISELCNIISTRTDHNPNFCLFLGSGASRSSNIPTAQELVEQWRAKTYKDLTNDLEERSPSEIKAWLSEHASDWYDEKREYSCLIEKLFPLRNNRRIFIETTVADKIPSIGYAYLVRIAEAGLLRTIFTTNFDDLLNEAFYQFSSERALVCAHDSSVDSISITSHRTKIIKLHGDYLFEDLKNTELETRRLDDNMKDKLEEFLKEYGLILVGYSGSDRSITRILNDMSDKQQYLPTGLFWCFRDSDEISEEALEILRKPNSFYVLTAGYDELMADFYSMLNTSATPFNSKLASDRASNIINTYLQSSILKSTTSTIIKKHLEALESDKNTSLLVDIMKDLNTERIASAGLTDNNLLVYFEIERALKDGALEDALTKLDLELAKTTDRKFKEILLHRRFLCSVRLNKFPQAKGAVKEMLSLDPANFYISLSECSLLESRSERLKHLEELKNRHPFSSRILNEYARELHEALEKRDKVRSGLRVDDVVNALKRSLEVNPSLSNPAWSQLFGYYASQKHGNKTNELLCDIVDRHLTQNAYSAKTTEILYRYCLKNKTIDYNGKSLFEYLNEAYTRQFPRDHADHIEVFVDACIDFGEHRRLRPILEEARTTEDLKENPQFALLMMNVFYDVFRDLSGAISFGRGFLKNTKNVSVELKLLELLLANNDPKRARESHLRIKGAIDQSRWVRLEAHILEAEGRYQDAIDAIESISDRRDFDEKYTSELSYLDLKMGSPARAVKRCREFLEQRYFAIRFEAEIINYEYGKMKDGKNIDKKRISSVADATDRQLVKGVCYSLLEQDADAMKIFRTEAEKRFSEIDDCLAWPAISRHQRELKIIKEELLKGKRSLTDLL